MVPKWSSAELLESFSQLEQAAGKSFNLALFIDGLDEFAGPQQDLIDFIRLFHGRPGVKVCVSSRPENSFLDAFSSGPNLRMQDFTTSDISAFVKDRFNNTTGFLDLRQAHPVEADQLVTAVIAKAQGVFLWVSVVVLTLCEGLTEGDKISDLQAVVDRLPGDLSELYTRIWTCIKPQYVEHSSQLFQIQKNAIAALDVVVLWLADDDKTNLNLDVNDIDDQQRGHIIKTMRRRLNSRTRGLLEISNSGTVDYLHRSARDWTESVWDDIRSKAPTFDPHLALLKGLVIESPKRELWSGLGHGMPTEFWTRVCLCFHHAAHVHDDPATNKFFAEVLDTLDKSLSQISISYPIGSSLPLYRDFSAPSLLMCVGGDLPPWPSTQSTAEPGRRSVTFLGLAAQFAILPYVRHKITSNPDFLQASAQQTSILSCAAMGFEPFCRPEIADLAGFYFKSLNAPVRLALVQLLLERGALTHRGALRKRKQRQQQQGQAMTQADLFARERETCDAIVQRAVYLGSMKDADPEELKYWHDVAGLFADYIETGQSAGATPEREELAANARRSDGSSGKRSFYHSVVKGFLKGRS